MTLGLLVRCRYWSILQVIAIVVYYRGRASSETVVKGCVGSQLNLTCEEKKIIQITSVVLGVSDCSGASCCIKDSDCTRSSSESHTTDVYRKCDYKESCTVTVVQERIGCRYWYSSNDNDFERIAYTCVDNPGNIAQSCVGSRINLSCEETKVIQITSVVLGDSNCNGTSCCIKNSDCTQNANSNHRTDVRRTCDNEHSCVVEVLQERIPCGLFGKVLWPNNDFERVTYICLNETKNDTMNSTAEQESTEGDYNSNHGSEFAEGCVGTRLDLTCKEMKVINITAVIVGISVGSACSIRPSVCTSYANESHTLDVHRRCNDRSNCTIDVLKEVIPCELEFSSSNSVEHIRYGCVDSPQNDMTSPDGTFRRPDNNKEAYDEGDTGRTTDQPNSHTSGIVIICVVCLIVIVAVVASVSVVTVRRRTKRQAKVSDAIKKSDLKTDKKDDIYVNDVVGISLSENAGSSVPIYINSGAKNIETPTSDYCELEVVAAPRIQRDSQYEQLDHGRNYEPLIVYEQLQ